MSLPEHHWHPDHPVCKDAMKAHQKVLSPFLKQWMSGQKIPPVLLLTGPSGIGKNAVAKSLARIFLSNSSPNSSDLPELNSYSSTPDVRIIEFEPQGSDSDSSGSLTGRYKVDQFRKLKEKMGFGSQSVLSKVVIIPQAQQMTLQASNSILKLLEEPPVGWSFILTSNDASLLLPTIVSRCQKIQLKPHTTQAMQEILSHLSTDARRVQLSAELCQGSIDRGILYLDDEVWEKRKLILSFLERPGTHLRELLEWGTAETTSTQRIEILMDTLEHTICDALQRPSTDAASTSFLFEQSRNIAETREKLRMPMNKKLLVGSILLPWLEATA